MISFYYKGILFSESNSAKDYSRDICLLSDWSEEIHNEKYVKALMSEKIPFQVSTFAAFDENLFLIYEINNDKDMFGIFDEKMSKFVPISYSDLRNIPYHSIKVLETNVNRSCSAIYRKEIDREYNNLIYPMKHMWTVYKSYIDKQNKFDVINTIKEAELIMSKGRHVETRDQLRQVFRKDEEFER